MLRKLLVFIICLGFSLFSCLPIKRSNTPTAESLKINPVLDSFCINRILELDDSLGTVRNHACETISLSATIQNYTQSLLSLDFKECPKKFEKAFEKHREAWVKMIAVTDHYPDLRGEMHDLFDIIEQSNHKEAFKISLDAVWATWKDVELAMQK